MITNEGRDAIGMTLATKTTSFVAVGIGSAEPAANDRQLGFEVVRAPVTTSSYDPATRTVTYKATLPSDAEFNMSEVALIASGHGDSAGDVLTSFDNTIEEWVGGTWVDTNVLIGTTGMSLSGDTATRTNPEGRSFRLSNSDTVRVAYYGGGGNIEIRLGNTPTDYLSFSFAVEAGHNVEPQAVRDMTRTGSVSLESINSITVIHSGTGNVTMDAIRVTSEAEGETMMIRQKLASSYHKVAGMPLDIEIPLVVSL